MSAVESWVWLSGLANVSIKTKAALINHYSDAERVFMAPCGEYESIPGVSKKDLPGLEVRDMRAVRRIIDDCAEQDIQIITMQDAQYPVCLRNIYAPPVVLYVKGRLPDVDAIPAIAVIGTRKASPYGLKLAWNMAYEINRSGAIVISGLTEGIDHAAAKGSMMAGGPCIAVLGTAHGKENSLIRDIMTVGAVVSEYAPGTESQKFFFRDRNRISSGFSRGVVVVEAPHRSGALLFAEEALEQGREIFAVPGNVDSPNSAGTNMLIQQGAKAVTCGWDVMSEFSTLFPDVIIRPGTQRAPMPLSIIQSNTGEAAQSTAADVTEKEAPEKKEIDNANLTGYIDWQKKLEGLSPEQQKILKAIGSGELAVDELIARSEMPAAKVVAQLTLLEIKGLIHRAAGGHVKLSDLNSAKK